MDELAPIADLTPAVTFRQNLERGEFTYQRCLACQAAVFYPRLACPSCGSTELSWHVSSGAGTIYSTTVSAPREAPPYAVVLVDLDDGFRMMSRADGIVPEKVAIGMRVQAAIVRENDSPLVVFAPVGRNAC